MIIFVSIMITATILGLLIGLIALAILHPEYFGLLMGIFVFIIITLMVHHELIKHLNR